MNNIGEVINWKEIIKSCREFNVQETMSVLKHDINMFWSWGSHNYVLDNMKRTRMFRMNVQGHHHKGHVYIFVSGMDLYNVYLTTSRGKIVKVIEGLYFDMLADAIDVAVERIPEYNH